MATGQNSDVQVRDVARPANPEAERVRTEGGGDAGTVRDVPRAQSSGDDLTNPLGEQTIRVRVRDGVEFFPQWLGGDRARGGEEYDAPLSMARAASMYVDQVTEDGKLKAVPHEQQQINAPEVQRASLTGMARHERVQALEGEEKQLSDRLEQVRKQIAHEREALNRDQAEHTKRAQAIPPEATESDRPQEGGDVARPAQGPSAVPVGGQGPGPGTPVSPVPVAPQQQTPTKGR